MNILADVTYEPASVWTVAIAAIALATLIVNTFGNRRSTINAAEAKTTAVDAKVAAENAAAQLTNNGGSSALDKIQLSQLGTAQEIKDEIKVVADSVAQLHARVGSIETRLDGTNGTKGGTP